MAVKQIKAFQTSDGLVFTDQADAELYETCLADPDGLYRYFRDATTDLQTHADELYQLRPRRLAIAKAAERLEDREKYLKERFIETLSKSGGGVVGRLAQVSVERDEVPQIKDFDALSAYIRKTKKTDEFGLLQRRLNNQAVEERWANGVKVPGVEPFQLVKVSVRKRK